MGVPFKSGVSVSIAGAAPVGSVCVSLKAGAVESRCARASTPASAGNFVARRSATAELLAPFRAVLDGDSLSTVPSDTATSRRTRAGNNSSKSGGIARPRYPAPFGRGARVQPTGVP